MAHLPPRLPDRGLAMVCKPGTAWKGGVGASASLPPFASRPGPSALSGSAWQTGA